MATTKIKNLPTVSLSQVATNNNFFLYMSDLTNFRDVKFQARDFFTSITLVKRGNPKNIFAQKDLFGKKAGVIKQYATQVTDTKSFQKTSQKYSIIMKEKTY